MSRLKKIILIGLLLVILGLTGLVLLNDREADRREQSYNQTELTELDKSSLEETLNLKKQLGNQLWPGFAAEEIPLILFNDTYEFIHGSENPGGAWEVVTEDEIQGKPYYYRSAENPQAFTTPIESGWAASMTSLEVLNREVFSMLRQELPFPINRLLPYQLVTYGNDFHITALIHESFHAFQALIARDKFERSQQVYSQERLYPYQNENFKMAWNQEGKLLAAALAAENRTEKLDLIAEFLTNREERRKEASLSPAALSYEKNLEWLEGLAKYLEIEFYQLAADNNQLTEVEFKTEPNYWDEDNKRLSESLGEHDGHNRFYLSGMAQARLLEQLEVRDWQEQIMQEDLYLEDLLKNHLAERNWKI